MCRSTFRLHTCAAQRVLWPKSIPRSRYFPYAADFSGPLTLPVPRKRAARRVVYFPGSTIGNFTPAQAAILLRQTAELCGHGGGLLLGADLRKDTPVIEAAYNDAQGVTAAFNRNILVRINRELAPISRLVSLLIALSSTPLRAGSRCISSAAATRESTSALRKSSARRRIDSDRVFVQVQLGQTE